MATCKNGDGRPTKSRFSDVCVKCYNRAYYLRKIAPLYQTHIPYTERLGEAIGYVTAHKRTIYYRGRAADQPCARCDNPAREWSLNPGSQWEQHGKRVLTISGSSTLVESRWSTDPFDYEPLCRDCHIRKDANS
jgi:hypothetical protein